MIPDTSFYAGDPILKRLYAMLPYFTDRQYLLRMMAERVVFLEKQRG